jgi:hypothetical protein
LRATFPLVAPFPTGVALLRTANETGFASIAFGDGSAWFTNYDRGTLTRVSG